LQEADKLKGIRAGIEDSEFNPEDREPWPDRLAWVKHLLSVADPTGAEETVYFGLRVQLGAEEAWGDVSFPDTVIHNFSLELDGVYATEEKYRKAIKEGVLDLFTALPADKQRGALDDASKAEEVGEPPEQWLELCEKLRANSLRLRRTGSSVHLDS
jgi:hypothetical protein